MRVLCPECGATASVNAKLAGKDFICPACKRMFPIPSENEANPVCQNCGWLMERGDVICVKCGWNAHTGELMETQLGSMEDDRPFPIRVLSKIAEIAPGLFRPLHILLFLLCCLTSLFLVWLMLFVIGLTMLFTSVTIGAAALMIYAQGVAFLFNDSILPLKAAMVEMEGDRWYGFLLVSFAPVAAAALLAALVAKLISTSH